jgi:hypothetical protein
MGFFDDENGTNSYWAKVMLAVLAIGLVQWGIQKYRKKRK